MRKMKRIIAIFAVAALMISNGAFVNAMALQNDERIVDKSVYMDSEQPIEVRIDALLEQMTLEEKVGQTTQLERSNANNYQTTANQIRNYYLGSILSGGGATPSNNTFEGWIEMIYAYQTAALETPLGIPIIYEIDAVHGDGNVAGVTIFPHNIGLGAADDEDLMEQIGAATAAEMRAVGHYGNFAPTIPTPKNIRWGRTYEGFGSEYDINGRLGAAYTRGLQGGIPEDASALNTDTDHPNQYEFMQSPTSAAATMKHYFGEGITYGDGGMNQGNTLIEGLPRDLSGMTPAELLENEVIAEMLEPYKEQVEAGARSMMPSFSSINGIKMHQQKELIDLIKLPKEEGGLGFTGFCVADYRAHTQLNGSTQKIKNAQMINAGVDLAMVIQASELTNQNTGWWPTTIQNVQEGAVSMERLDDAVRRILRVKFEMGLFENPMPDVTDLQAEIYSDENIEIARDAVRKSMVMLKNDNDIVGSLKDMDSIMLTGRFAHNMGYQSGGWTIEWQGVNGNNRGIAGTTFLEATQKVVDTVGYSSNGTRNENDDTDYDAVVLCLGETPYAEGNGDASANGTGSRNTLQLDAADITALQNAQRDFPDAPIVVVLFSGRPMIINNQIDDMDGLVVAWWPGSAGDGLADVLFGDYDFTGTTPFAWPWYSEWINDESKDVMFDLGYGLKKGETGEPIVAPERQTRPYQVYANGTRTNISSGSFGNGTGLAAVEPSPQKNRYGYLNPVTLASPNAANFGDANWVEYDINVQANGTYSFALEYVSAANIANGFTIDIDGTQVAAYDLINTSNSTIATESIDAALSEGVHTLRVNYGSGGVITLKNIRINLSGAEEPDINMSVLPSTIAEDHEATVNVTADIADGAVAKIENSNSTIASAVFTDGVAKFNLTADNTATAGTYSVNVYDEYGTVIDTRSFEILAYDHSIFEMNYWNASNNVYAAFGDNVTIDDNFTININGVDETFTIIDETTILLDLDYDNFNDVNDIIVSGVNLNRYFPDYTFTLYTQWDKDNGSIMVPNDISIIGGGKASTDEPKGSVPDTDKLPAWVALEVAVDSLYTSLLEFSVDYAEKAVARGEVDQLIEKVKTAFYEALANAKTVLENAKSDLPTVTQDDVDAAAETLMTAIHYLDFIAADKSDLDRFIALAEKYENPTEYTPASYAPFQTALENARTLQADEDLMKGIDDEAISEAVAKLSDAIFGLRIIPDKGKLEGLLNKAKAYDLSLYTAKTVDVFTTAVTAAEEIMDNENASQKEVDKTASDLQSAMDDLKTVSAAKNNGTDANGTGNNSVNPNATNTKNAGSSNPKTGDTAPLAGLFMAFLSGCIVLTILRKKLNK